MGEQRACVVEHERHDQPRPDPAIVLVAVTLRYNAHEEANDGVRMQPRSAILLPNLLPANLIEEDNRHGIDALALGKVSVPVEIHNSNLDSKCLQQQRGSFDNHAAPPNL